MTSPLLCAPLIFVALAMLAVPAAAQDPFSDDLTRTSRAPVVRGGPDVVSRAFEHEPGLMAAVAGHDSLELRQFLWKFLAPDERDAVTRAMRAAGDVPANVTGLLASPDEYRYDRAFCFTPEARAAVLAATGLPASSFDASGRIVPAREVIAKQDAIAQALFAHHHARGQDPFATPAAPAAPATADDRRIADVRERALAGFPLALTPGVRGRVRAAELDPAALERTARRSGLPAPDAAAAARRLKWARSVLEEHRALDEAGGSGVARDPLVIAALDAVQRYAVDGDAMLPGAAFPRTTNSVRLLFGHKDAELMAIYAEVEKMMDTATRAIWVDLFYLGGSLNDPPGRDNMGVRLLRYLERRKREGIDVRLLLSPKDTGFTSEATYRHAVHSLGARAFDLAALPGAIPPRVNHDKLVVVDHGRAAMVGTMNFDANGQGHGGHHETVTLVRGPAAAILAWSHQVNWRMAGGADAAGDDEAVRRAMAAEPPAPAGDEVSAPVWVTLSHPAVQNTAERLLDWIDAVPRGEEIRVWMYQFGDKDVVAALAAAVRRGVKLTMLSDPHSGPVPQASFLPNLAGFAPLSDAFAAAAGGGAIHVLDREVSGTYMHSKVGVFGTDRFTIGSTNWTHVGIRRNAEIAIFVESAALVTKLRERFDLDLKAEAGGKPFFPTLEAYRVAHPSYGNVDRPFLDRVARMMDEFY